MKKAKLITWLLILAGLSAFINATYASEYPTTYSGCNTPDITLRSGNVAYTISACNLGTSVAGTWEESYWSYFQWGNNYWFPNTWFAQSTVRVNGSGFWPQNYFYSGVFIRGSVNWSSVSNFNLWWWLTNTNESRQWPCATWYHVPSIQDWRNLLCLWLWQNNISCAPSSLYYSYSFTGTATLSQF